MLNWDEESFSERRNIVVNEPCKKAVIAAPDILRRLNTKMRVQVSEQAYYLRNFSMWGVCTLASLEVTSRKLISSRRLNAVHVETLHRDAVWNPPHGIDRQYPWLTIAPFSVPEFLLQKGWQPFLWIYSLFAWPTAIITWHSHDFLTKCHNSLNETLENDSLTSFHPLADVSLWIGMLVFANEDDLYDKCLIIIEFHSRVTLTSRAVTFVTATTQNNVLKPLGSAFIYVNKLCPLLYFVVCMLYRLCG